MRHPALYLALAACLGFIGPVADAAPSRHGKVSKKMAAKARDKVAPTIDDDEAPRKAARRKRPRAARERVAFESDVAEEDDRVDVVHAAAKNRKGTMKKRTKDWHVVIGPYLWASAVDANVSLGPSSVGASVDFFTLERHAKYGAEVLAEAHYGRFSLFTDFLYGVIAINGDKAIGPLMVSLNGTASSLLFDGAAGYRVAGDEQSVLSLEARAGVRYQRTAIAGAVSIGGTEVAGSKQVDTGTDAVAGARVFVRPLHWLFASATVDLGVVGDSNLTWSASADASVRITSRVLFSLGYRRLTIDRANVQMVMHGPRAALQLVF